MFKSPHDGSDMLLTPEQSMFIQNQIGADIIMALDDVVSSKISGPRVEVGLCQSDRRAALERLFPGGHASLDQVAG